MEDGFSALGLEPALLESLVALGYEEPTPIQREAIPPLLAGRDLLGQAATGTGKTAAFALPMLQRLADGSPREGVSALVLVPTRELAMQVAEAVHRYGRALRVRVLPVYGGAAMVQQLRVLARGVDVVVATPGRALDHIRRGSLALERVRIVVLDEADEMLDMGFAEDLEAILAATPEVRQTALFSATVPARIRAIAAKHLDNPVEIRIAREKLAAGAVPKVRHLAYVVPRAHKLATLGRVLDMESPTSAIVFCRTRTEVDELVETLNARGYRAEALHGGLSQEQRDRVMKKFRANTADLLVATDVAARGLDIEHVSHVINYDVPSAADGYVHRIGRTGRAGREGVAITIAEPREHRLLRNIEQITKQKIELAQVPTVADLKARRLDVTKATLREALVAGDLDGARVVVESLAGEFDLRDVAAAAVKLLHESSAGPGAGEQGDIPIVDVARPRGTDRFGGGERAAKGAHEGKGERAARDKRGEKSGSRRPEGATRKRRERAAPAWQVARLFVGAGRKAGVRPADLVGAIANEVGIESNVIGAIEIADRHSLVEVPDEIADDIVDALRATLIKGKRVMVRRDRDGA